MTKYPNKIDSNAELPAISDNVSEIGAEALNSLRNAVIAIEKTVGVNPQGSGSSLADRVSVSINEDGTLKASALPSTLVELPLSDDDIAENAAIKESKLDLDHSTQSLKNNIESQNIDIAALQSNSASIANRLAKHSGGIGDRHSSSQVDHIFDDGYLSGPGTAVGTSINYIWGSLLSHKDEKSAIEHFASSIAYEPRELTPGETSVIESTNVQDAITDVETAFVEDRRKHNDEAHSNGVATDGYVAVNGQAGVSDASLAVSRYQPNTGSDILKIGLCNSSVVKSKGLALTSIHTGANSIDIEVSIGNSIRTIEITDLHNAIYPSSSGKVSLLGLVDFLNARFADTSVSAHFPLTAFASKDGELVLQHNIAREDCTITIKEPGSKSAIEALGFGNLVDLTVSPVSQHSFLINGNRYTELETVVDGNSSQVSLSSTVDLGQDVSSVGLNIQPNMLLHIYNHSEASSNGTYRIVSVGETSVELAENLAPGFFNFVIYSDVFNTNSITSDRRVLDLYLDEERIPIVSERANIVYGGVQGVKIVEISPGFDAFSGTFKLDNFADYSEMYFVDADGYEGVHTAFDHGYIGLLRVNSVNNNSYATILVFDVSPVAGTDTITVVNSESSDSKLLLGTTHHNGVTDIEIPLDRRNMGLVGAAVISTDFADGVVGQLTRDLHTNGIVSGFDITNLTATSVRVRGGRAYIGGRLVSKPSEIIEVTNIAVSDGKWNLILNKNGIFDLFFEGDGYGTTYSIADILLSKELILIAQLTISGGQVETYNDGRWFINDIESKIELTVDDRELGSGMFRSLDSAVLYSKNAPNDSKSQISILSDLSVGKDLTVNANSKIVAFRDLSVSGDLVIADGAELIVYGSLSVTGDVQVSDGAVLSIHNGGMINDIALMSNSSIFVGGDLSADSITLSGSSISLFGIPENRPTVSFAGGNDGIDATASDLVIKGIDFIMTFSTFDILDFNTVNGASISDCSFSQSTNLSLSDLNLGTRVGINCSGCSNINILDGYFNNLGTAVLMTESSRFTIEGSAFESIGTAVSIIDSSEGFINRNLINKFSNVGIKVAADSSSSNNISITDNICLEKFSISATPVAGISLLSSSSRVSRNLFSQTSAQDIILVEDQYNTIDSNVLINTTSSEYAINTTEADNIIEHNSLEGHNGKVLYAEDSLINGNLFSGTDNSSSKVIDVVGTTSCTFSNNIVNLSTNGTVEFSKALISNNIVRGSAITIDDSGYVVGNYFDVWTAVTNAITCTITGGLFENNYIFSGASDNVLIISGGDYVCLGNVLKSSITQTGIRVQGSGHKIVSSNLIASSGTSLYGIYLDSSNSLVDGNYIYGAKSIGGGDIVASTGATNISIVGNSAKGTGGAERVFHSDSAPINCFIGYNKGALEHRGYPIYGGHATGNWTVSSSGFESTHPAAKIYLPLNGLPTGVKLESINVLVSNSGGAGAATIRAFKRSSSSLTSTAISSLTGVPAGTTSYFNIPISGTHYVSSSSSFFVVIEMASSSNVKFGQVVANIRV